MRTILNLLCILIGVSASATEANKAMALPTSENIAHAWVAVGDGTHYRLVLGNGGQGTLGVKPRGQAVLSYTVQAVTLDRYSIRLQLAPTQQSGEAAIVVGEAYRPYLKLKSKSIFGKRMITFYPEVDWIQAEDELRSLTLTESH